MIRDIANLLGLAQTYEYEEKITILNACAKVPKQISDDPSHFSDRKKRIYNFLIQNPVAVLSSVTLGGDVHGVVIFYAVKNDFSLIFMTRVNTRKYNNISHNNNVGLTVYDPKSQTTAQICGTVTQTDTVVDSAASRVLESTSQTDTSGLAPISKQQKYKSVSLTIHPSQIHMAYFANTESGEYDNILESVESFDLNMN